jgi:hypothetical protein
MKFITTIELGDKTVSIEDECSSEHEMFKKLAFYHSIPSEGPNGEQDLVFCHRNPKNFDYFSVLCPSAKQQFTFGMANRPDKSLFAKGWEPIKFHLGERFARYEEEGQSGGSSSKRLEPQPQPVADKKAANVAAVAAQAPLLKHPACPANAMPDEWDARCEFVAQLDAAVLLWPRTDVEAWLRGLWGNSFKWELRYYMRDAEGLKKVLGMANTCVVDWAGSDQCPDAQKPFLLKALCASLGIYDQAADVLKQFTSPNGTDWINAVGQVQLVAKQHAAKARTKGAVA